LDERLITLKEEDIINLDLTESWRPLELALMRYHDSGEDSAITIRNDFSDPEKIYPSVFFRGEEGFEDWELIALGRCGQRVLDVGAGVGAHGLVLQNRGHQVTSLELLPGAVRIMKDRGVKDTRVGRLEDLSDNDLDYDTILLLMNGSMLAGTTVGLEHLLRSCLSRTTEDGVIIMDSTDLRLVGDLDEQVNQEFVGELHYQLEFEDQAGEVFPQLFIDPELLAKVSGDLDLLTDVIWQGDQGHYLAELKRG
jgi:SAM-dependent methyltransferase